MSRVAALLLVLLVAAPAARTSTTRTAVKVLVRTKTPIAAFAQNAVSVAWGVERAKGCKAALHIRLLATGRERVVYAPRCYDYPFYEPQLVGLAGGRALWLAGDTVSHWGDDTYLLVAGAGATRAHQLAYVPQQWGGGEWVTAIASDGATLAYGFVNSGCNENEGTCDKYPITGAAFTLAGTTRKAVPQSGPPLDIAVGGNRIALLPARQSGNVADQWSIPPADDPLVVRNLATGSLVVQIPPAGGSFREVALSRNTVAAFAERSDGLHVERYNASSGRLVDSTLVPANSSDLSLAGARAVFRSGRKIELIAAGSTTVTTIAVAAAEPIALSVSGNRVAWAENRPGAGRIVAAVL
ncbi:MAG: hypothetical protein ABSB96_10085 [Gaiellaceae bacterium]